MKVVYIDCDCDWIEKNYGVFIGVGMFFDIYFMVMMGGEIFMVYKDGVLFIVYFDIYFGFFFDVFCVGLVSDMVRGIY